MASATGYSQCIGGKSFHCIPSMTTQQIAKLRQLHATRKAAQNVYHDCLKRNAAAAERHAAERACSAAVAALTKFTASLA